ncbi:MAG TPA: amidohydrolase family protein [Pyrinomonadaceae bacterium]|nr:amidohydrolase family protein [Pyrinomonadaceae bacterium]
MRKLPVIFLVLSIAINAQGLSLQDPRNEDEASSRQTPIAPPTISAQAQAQDPPNKDKQLQDEKKRVEQLQEALNKPEAWSVEAEHGPATTVEFDTDEGTWMSCDVSPDGQSIVFDLLGDIYRMPIAGGRAELLSGGVSWEVQPRYSPDGKLISFTSDRDGGDNIWLMDADGKNRRQMTKETLRLVNNAEWTPDGQYLVVRKHFVDQRSLGAGEIWMYHVSGGKGVQLTERPNWTANIGEPVVDPKGQFVYFVASGAFDYNKNVYDNIYWIERYDLAKGRRAVFVRSAGGAVRPQVSPDGKYLSFIRRVGLKSVLFLREIESGREWPIYDNLTHDQQETWAIFGTYPGYSWTPDAKSIVIYARGKLMRVGVESKQAALIPFTAHVAQRVTEAVRFAQRVAPEREQARLLRWAERSGERIVYSALGKLYLKDGASAPRRLFPDSTQLEYAPNFSADGSRITYVTWTDAEKGAVWIANSDGTNAVKITTTADQYANPVFSPDGQKVAYLKGRGSIYHEEDLASESTFEIHYWDGQKHSYVMDLQSRGPNARMPILSFGPQSERIFFLEAGGGPPPAPTEPARFINYLSSVKLTGDDVKRHIEASFSSEIVPSPDHKWIAFKELHKLYVAPFPMTGRTLKLSAVETTVPVKQLTMQTGGAWLAWAPDSKSVQWTRGENFYEQTLDNVLRPLAKDEKAPEPRATKIGFDFDTARPRGLVALTNARLITMRGEEVVERGTILVEDNRIKAVGARVNVPANARRIDMAGKTIMPGLVDVHAHMSYDTLDIIPEKQWPYWANLAYGVTTTHDPSAATQTVFAQSEMVKAGAMVGPRVFSTGYVLYGAENAEKAVVNSYADARAHLERLKAVGAFSVKSYNQPRRDQRQRIIRAARDLEMMVVPEGGSTYFFNMTHILDGHTGIEHAIPVAPLYKDALTLLARSRTGYTPTLIVGFGGLWGENYWYQHTDVFKNEKLLRFTPRRIIDARARRRLLAPEDDFYHFELAKTTRDVVRAGGRAQLGAHGQLQGLGAHWELWMLQQGGLTPLEAIRAGTLDGARYLGLDKELGSLEAGKLADLMVLEKNPLDNIRNSESITHVMINGTLYDTRNMDEIYPQAKPRMKFFWERGEQN